MHLPSKFRVVVTTLVDFRLLGRDPDSLSLAPDALATALRLAHVQRKATQVAFLAMCSRQDLNLEYDVRSVA